MTDIDTSTTTPPMPWAETVRGSWALSTVVLALEGWSAEQGLSASVVMKVRPDAGVDVSLDILANAPIQADAALARNALAALRTRLNDCEDLRDLMAQIDHLRARGAEPQVLDEAIETAERLATRVDPARALRAPPTVTSLVAAHRPPESTA